MFLPLRQPKKDKDMPRLSTLRADRSLCRSTRDPKPPGNGSDELPRAGTASRSSSIRRHRLTSLNNERGGAFIAIAAVESKGFEIRPINQRVCTSRFSAKRVAPT